MRQFLVTKFACAKCGGNLSITYDKPKTSGGYEEGQPTGADMVEQIVVVEPCQPCMTPLHEIKRALAVLGIGEKQC